jgi:hypothetical protein
MTTADAVRTTALQLAENAIPTEDAIRQLLEVSREKRVAVVLARRNFFKDLEGHPDDRVLTRATELLDGVLERLPLA